MCVKNTTIVAQLGEVTTTWIVEHVEIANKIVPDQYQASMFI